MRVFTILSSIASGAGFVLAIVLIPGVANWLYPLPLIVILTLALLASWAVFLFRSRAPSSADQATLDKLFALLPTKAVRRIQVEDFDAPWPEDITYPVVVFWQELQGPENHFRSRGLERPRQRLMRAAMKFVEAEAMQGYDHPRLDNRRDTGLTVCELELAPEKRALADERRSTIHTAAVEFAQAHAALVAAASRRRLALQALSGEPPLRRCRE